MKSQLRCTIADYDVLDSPATSQPIFPQSYAAIAYDYYSDAHQTTRNFDDTTRTAMRVIAPSIGEHLSGLLIDIGAGAGRVPDYFEGSEPDLLYELDIAKSMLMLGGTRRRASRVCGSALRMPFRDATADICTAFLFDPFNRPPFEEEVRRVLRPGGLFLGTLPSPHFTEPTRARLGLPRDCTAFTTSTGDKYLVKSFISEVSELEERFRRAGFSNVSCQELMFDSDYGRPPSAQICRAASIKGIAVTDLPVVTLITCS